MYKVVFPGADLPILRKKSARYTIANTCGEFLMYFIAER